MKYRDEQKHRVASLLAGKVIFGHDTGGGMFMGRKREFVLTNSDLNIFPSILESVKNYFKENDVAWWRGESPTGHTLSSQIACINHLFPIRHDKAEVLKIARSIDPRFVDVLVIDTDKYLPAYIQFETVSDTDHLNEKASTRGSNCTSVDALIYALRENGQRVILPIEWKYTEEYENQSKAEGQQGNTRKGRYTSLINDSHQLQSKNQSVYYYEPFYQLMRQTLWAEQMIRNKGSETVKADDYIHLHVIPPENHDLLHKTYMCSKMDMEQTWRAQLTDQKNIRSLRQMSSSLQSIRRSMVRY
jgi:hypothetical protein